MSELKTVDQIELDYSKSQIYRRIEMLVENGLMNPPKRGKHNQYLLSKEDVNLLEELKCLEEEHDTLTEAVANLESGATEADTKEEVKERVERLEKKTQVLEDELAAQKDRINHPGLRWADRLRKGVKRVFDWLK